ncbi:MAG: hypothetical protein DWH91_13530 [Planctomycetota bacterium]|nr:MAG: hypothetical protein DWH91_13530 [Planctomycetota bacterium]
MGQVAWNEIRATLTESPPRTIAAFLLLLGVGFAITSPTKPQRVAETGRDVFQLDKVVEALDGVSLVSTDAEDRPALTSRSSGHEVYRDAAIQQALNVADEAEPLHRTVMPVSAQRPSAEKPSKPPVWLLGILEDQP